MIVFVQSPYAGDVDLNVAYAKLACVDAMRRGETPFASHLLYPQMLDDKDQKQRALGLKMERDLFFSCCHSCAVAIYVDLGISGGMREFIWFATILHSPILYRNILPLNDSPIRVEDLRQLLDQELGRLSRIL